jgi:hypothetical protein
MWAISPLFKSPQNGAGEVTFRSDIVLDRLRDVRPLTTGRLRPRLRKILLVAEKLVRVEVSDVINHFLRQQAIFAILGAGLREVFEKLNADAQLHCCFDFRYQGQTSSNRPFERVKSTLRFFKEATVFHGDIFN